jgi:uracil-DNA glycosylase
VTGAGNRLLEPLAAQLQRLDSTDWWPLLARWSTSPVGRSLLQAVDARVQAQATVFPADVFRPLALTPRASVRVVILGQDPYHGPDQAEGLAFSVRDGQPCPPSLRNIFKELQRDLGLALPPKTSGSLVPWARQGVLLLNTCLTVEQGRPACHSQLGWQALTDAICVDLFESQSPQVFMLWGGHAQALAKNWGPAQGANPLRKAGGAGLESESTAPARPKLLLRCNHPSPLSALRGPQPFVGCGHFGQANAWLQAVGARPVDWRIGPAPGML